MFCSKCGKAIDDGSKFCPFCGHTLADGSGDGGEPAAQRNTKGGTGRKRKGKKAAPAIAVACMAAVAVLLVTAGVSMFRTAGGKPIEKSFLGKIFSLSWGEISDMSARDFRDMMKEEDIRYEYEEESDSSWSLIMKETTGFMGGDAAVGIFFEAYAQENREELYAQTYHEEFIILYETRDEREESYEKIRRYLDRNLVKNAMAVDMTSDAAIYCGLSGDIAGVDGAKGTWYLAGECTDEERDRYFKALMSAYEQEEMEADADIDILKESLDGCTIYKVVSLYSVTLDDDMTDSLNDDLEIDYAAYSNSVCMLDIEYKPVNKLEFASGFAMMGWDFLGGREIDVDKVKSSLDDGFQPSVDKVIDEEAEKIAGYRRKKHVGDVESELAETRIYSALYMLDKHDYDIFTYQYVDKIDKNIWYVDNFGYDMEKGSKVNLSKYLDSVTVYCAAEYNYDMDSSEKFASDLDREIYLASKGYDAASKSAINLSGYMNSANVYCAVKYNYDVGASAFFENELDAVLYLVEKGYNPETRGAFASEDERRLWVMANYGYDIAAEKEVDKEVGKALMAYQEYVPESDWLGDERFPKYDLLYLNDDDIPEFVSWDDSHVMSYANGIIQADYPNFITHIYYIPKEGKIKIVSGGNGSWHYTETLELKDGAFNTLFAAEHYMETCTVNGEPVDSETYSKSCSENGVDYDSSIHIEDIDEHYDSVLEAYDALRIVDYFVNMPEIDKFELSDGILTVSTNDGKYGWNASSPFSISCPVAEDCIWEQGHYEADFVKDRDISYEELKETITSEFDWYESIYEENGPEWFQQYGIEGPMGIQITVRDEAVVRVRVTGS